VLFKATLNEECMYLIQKGRGRKKKILLPPNLQPGVIRFPEKQDIFIYKYILDDRIYD
jgi:hypothetical protein